MVLLPLCLNLLLFIPIRRDIGLIIFDNRNIVDTHKLTQFYTAPTAIRVLRKLGDDHVKSFNLSSLRILGSVGEPINPEAWNWYNQVVGHHNCNIVDTYWQTGLFYFI